MARSISCIGIALIVLLILPAVGQTVVAPPPPHPPLAAEALKAVDPMQQLAEGEVDPVALMRQMGAKEEDILGIQLMSQVMGADMGQVMLLMMLADQGKKNDPGKKDDDIMGLMFLMKAMGGGAKQPTALLQGDKLLVIEDGMVYKIDTDAMKVEGSVGYRKAKEGAGGLAALLPLIMGAQGKAQATQCLNNMKQLCLAAQMHVQETGGALPTEQWQDQLANYVNDRALYVCPHAPQQGVAYVINEALLGALMQDIKRPAQTVLFFESDIAAEWPFGGVAAVSGQPRHDGRVVVGFADGHVQQVSPAELRQLLGQDPFK